MSLTRYNRLAIILHWVMAICFIIMLASGLALEYLEIEKSLKYDMYQWHKSLGLILLAAFFLRLAIRIIKPLPKWPEELSEFDKKAAHVGHILLYVCMILVPLAGWFMVSSSPYGLPTYIFGLFEWPHIPGVASNDFVNTSSKIAHKYIAYAFIALIAIHIGATFKHLIFEKINLLPRMGIGKQKD